MVANKGIDWAEILPRVEGMTSTEVARMYGVTDSTVRKARRRWSAVLQSRASAPEGPVTTYKAERPKTDGAQWSAVPQSAVPERHIVKGVSTYAKRDDAGNWVATGQWIKTDRERESFLEALRGIADEVKEQAPPPVHGPPPGPDSTLLVVPWGDPHIGMLSWATETGQRWTLRDAEEVHVESTRRLIDRSPDAARCLIVGMGDNLHTNSRKALTPASGHLLDVDTRFAEMMHVAQRTFRRSIDVALERVAAVDVVLLSGNHDPDAAQAIAFILAAWYHREPRVRIDLRMSKYRHYVWGRCLLGMVHGDTRKTQQLHGVMTNEWPDLVGRCAWRCWYTGHLHTHLEHTLDDGARVVQVETLASRDAYAAEGGWATRRSVACHVWDREQGHVGTLHERIPHHRAQRLAPPSDLVGWDESEGLLLT